MGRRWRVSEDQKGPLHGVRVVDLTRVMSGPYCTMMLGDMGADIIKVERPGVGDDTRIWGPPFVEQPGVERESAYFLSVNRNKRSIALDLKTEDGIEVLWKLIEQADVLVENFSPGTIARLGFSPEVVLERKPELIFCSISGFGQTGPSSNQPAYDLIIQGMSGMMSVTGPPGQPTKMGVPIADIACGMFAAFAISSALFHREQSGEGQFIDTTMLGGQIALLSYQAAIFFATRQQPESTWNAHPIVGPYQPVAVSDGMVNVAIGNDALWRRFTSATSLDALGTDPVFSTNEGRITNLQELIGLIEEGLSSWTSKQLLEALEQASVPAGPISTLPEVFNDVQSQHLQMELPMIHETLGEIPTTGFPYQLSKTPPSIRSAPALLGRHSVDVLTELGYSSERIEQITRTQVGS